MHASVKKATTLAVAMAYNVLGPNRSYVDPKWFKLVATDDDGVECASALIYPLNAYFADEDVLESEDVDADIVKFIDENFAGGVVRKLLAANMHDLLRYFEASASLTDKRLRESAHIDVDTLMDVLPIVQFGLIGVSNYKHVLKNPLDPREFVDVYRSVKNRLIRDRNQH